jgi:hypothetical protein
MNNILRLSNFSKLMMIKQDHYDTAKPTER